MLKVTIVTRIQIYEHRIFLVPKHEEIDPMPYYHQNGSLHKLEFTVQLENHYQNLKVKCSGIQQKVQLDI